MFHILSVLAEPLPAAEACWPFSLPAMFTRSSTTPGHVLEHAPGVARVRGLLSSAVSRVVAVPRRLVSTMGVSAVTVTVSSTLATFMPNVELDVLAGDRTSRASRRSRRG